MTKMFSYGLTKVLSPVKDASPLQDLNVVLLFLMGLPFEATATCALLHLPRKPSFLLAIISTRRVGASQAIMVGSLDTPFYPEKIPFEDLPRLPAEPGQSCALLNRTAR